ICIPIGIILSIQAYITISRWESPSLLRIGVPLPLQAELRRIEIITFYRRYHGVCFSDIRFTIRGNRFATIIFIIYAHYRAAIFPLYRFKMLHTIICAYVSKIYAHYRPAIFPLYRLQMRHTTIWPFILKMDKPPFTRLRLYKPTLMWAVYFGLSLIQHPLHLVRAIYIFGT